ncbi:LysR family transcriptional regulator [Moraxella caviae]|uniref:Gcv operon activator n=1 Tax=Moraxella caviae TaxID=34060 RepID=A0A1S9ZZK7_9GAMM|nr:LysR substrate-binding domain-containing protein [Moraxella caviae]OOR88868.1 LysR family transcriptional regulator [Moraxella caviae]STZ10232.1 Gcv operon activator [Moraxella caviae]
MHTLSFRKYPSTTALQCFESSARHQSFTRAAKELHMTQSAVSKQVAQLEDTLKIALFFRSAQGIVLTPAGKTYYTEVLNILKSLEFATIDIMAHGDKADTLKINAHPTFCAQWLIPALRDFNQSHPDIHLDIQEQFGNFIERSDAELAFLNGDGVWPGMTAIKLFDEQCIAVCHPQFLTHPIDSAYELANHALIQLNSRPALWYHFFDTHESMPANSFQGPRFDTFRTCINAAKNHYGIALIPHNLVMNELQSGELVMAWHTPLITEKAYYMAYRTELGNTRRIKIAIDWINRYIADTHA